MNSIEEIQKIKSTTESVNREARLAKAVVESLIDERKELIEIKYGALRDTGMTQADAKSKATYNEEVIKLRVKITDARNKLAQEWAKLMAHEDYVRLLISYNSTKREELKLGI